MAAVQDLKAQYDALTDAQKAAILDDPSASSWADSESGNLGVGLSRSGTAAPVADAVGGAPLDRPTQKFVSFDDLIPKAQPISAAPASSVSFDDLIPKGQARPQVSFDDLIPAAATEAGQIKQQLTQGKIDQPTALRELGSLESRPETNLEDTVGEIAYPAAKATAITGAGLLGMAAGAAGGAATGPAAPVAAPLGGLAGFGAVSKATAKGIEALENYLSEESPTYEAGKDESEQQAPVLAETGKLLPDVALAGGSAAGYMETAAAKGIRALLTKAAASAVGMPIGQQIVNPLLGGGVLSPREALNASLGGAAYGGAGGEKPDVAGLQDAMRKSQGDALTGGEKPETVQQTVPPGTPKAPQADVPFEAGMSEGPGASAATELKGPTIIALANRQVDAERAQRGELPLMDPARKAMGKSWDEGMTRLETDKNAGFDMVNDILTGKKKSTSEVDHAILLHEKISVRNNRDQAAERAVDQNSTDEERENASALWNHLNERVNQIDQAIHDSGTMAGRALQFRNALANDDFTFAGMERQSAAQKGRPLNRDEVAGVKAKSDEIQKVTDAATKAESESGSKEASETKTKQLKTEAKNKPVAPKDAVNRGQKTLDAIARLSAKDGSLKNLGPLIQRLALNFVRAGITNREPLIDAVHAQLVGIIPDITREQTRDAISGYGDFKELDQEPAKKILRDLKGQMQQIGKIEDMQSSNPPKKTGLERREMSDAERALQKQVNELKRQGGFDVTDPQTQLKSALDAVKTRLKNQLRDYALQFETGERPTGSAGIEYDIEAEKLRDMRDRVSKTLDAIGEKSTLSDDQKIKIASDTLDRQIEIASKELSEGNLYPKAGKLGVTSPSLEAKRSELAALREQRQELRDAGSQMLEFNAESAVEKSIKEYDRLLQGGERSATQSPVETPNLERLRAERDAMAQLYREMNASPKKSAEEIAMASVQKSISEYDRLLQGGEPVQRKAPIDTPNLERLRAERNAMAKLYQQMKSGPKRSAEEIALQSYKTRTATRIADTERRLASGDFSTQPRRITALDPEAQALKAKAENLKTKWLQGQELERLANRTLPEKAMDIWSKIRRAFVLSSPVTIKKLGVAAGLRMGITPAEEMVGSVIGRLPFVSRVANLAPRQGAGFSPKAEALAISDGLTKGLTDGLKKLSTGKSDLDSVFGKRQISPKSWLDFIGNIHGAMKAPTFRNEFARSYQLRGDFYQGKGIDISTPEAKTKIATEAYTDALRSIFMNDSRLTSSYNRFLGGLEQADKFGNISVGAKALATALRTLMPVVKIPTNIVGEMKEYATGLVTGGIDVARANMGDNLKNVTPDQADSMMRQLKKGTVGAIAAGAVGAGVIKAGGYYQQGEKRDKKDIQAGHLQVGDADFSPTDIHHPLSGVAQMAATLMRVKDSKLRKKDEEPQGIGYGLLHAGLGALEDTPFIGEALRLSKFYDPHQTGSVLGEQAKSLAVPLGIQWWAQHRDVDANGDPVRRDPRTILQHIQTGIPGLREGVPEKAIKPLQTEEIKSRSMTTHLRRLRLRP